MTSRAGSAASPAPGAPTIAETASFGTDAKTGAESSTLRYVWEMPLNDDRARNEFPIVKTPHDAYDNIANIKSQYANQAAGTNWIVPFEQADAAWLMRKRNAEEKAAFDTWVMQKFDVTDPTQNMLLQSIAPELYRRREEIIDQQQDLVSKYAKLRLRGAKTLEDLRFEWLLETGRISLPKGPIWDPHQWRLLQYNNPGANANADNVANIARYRYGLFSPIRWLLWGERGWAPTGNRADIRGNPAHMFDETAIGNTLPTDPAFANRWGPYAPYPQVGVAVDPGAAAFADNPVQVGNMQTLFRNAAAPTY